MRDSLRGGAQWRGGWAEKQIHEGGKTDTKHGFIKGKREGGGKGNKKGRGRRAVECGVVRGE